MNRTSIHHKQGDYSQSWQNNVSRYNKITSVDSSKINNKMLRKQISI